MAFLLDQGPASVFRLDDNLPTLAGGAVRSSPRSIPAFAGSLDLSFGGRGWVLCCQSCSIDLISACPLAVSLTR